MMWMFNGSKIDQLNFNSLNTSKVTDMRGMFQAFKTNGVIDLTGFDTSLVTNMSGMFHGAFNKVEISNFDTSEVTNMSDHVRLLQIYRVLGSF